MEKLEQYTHVFLARLGPYGDMYTREEGRKKERKAEITRELGGEASSRLDSTYAHTASGTRGPRERGRRE